MSKETQELHISVEAFNILLEYAEKHELMSRSKGGRAVKAVEHIAEQIKGNSEKQHHE